MKKLHTKEEIKNTANELGIQIKQEIIELLARSTQFFSSVVGNELVLATFVPMIPSLIYDSVKREILEKEILDLGEQLFEEKEKVNKNFINSSLGRKLFKDIVAEILEETDKDKIGFQKRFLLNAFTQNEPNNERLSAYHRILISLEPPQLRILSAVANRKETVAKIMQKNDLNKPDIPLELKNDVRRLLSIDDAIFERSLTRLESENLIMTKSAETLWCTGKYDKQYKDQAIERMESTLNQIVTDFGKDFVSYFKDNS